jgi:hypothetical protein
MAAGLAMQEFVAWQFHKHGHHNLERIVRFVSIGSNVWGIAQSKANEAW